MKKKLTYILIVIATILVLASPAYAEGDKVRGDIGTGHVHQQMVMDPDQMP